MKGYRLFLAAVVLLLVIVFIVVNGFLSNVLDRDGDGGRSHQVEINRLQNQIKQLGFSKIDLQKYVCVKQVTMLPKDAAEEEKSHFFAGNGSDYAIKEIDGTYYRFDYRIQVIYEYKKIRGIVNIAMGIMAMTVLFLLFYLQVRLISPFQKMKEIPFELSKGNLSVGLTENRNHFFGRFLWGLDLLRENLEEERQKELSLQKEKKTLILSISHDIKTPLSAIKLYAKVLSKDLYKSEEKQIEIAERIGAKADEIERFVSDIMKTSSENFLSAEVQNGEFYLEEVIQQIREYYSEKFSLLKIRFEILPYENCLLKGDCDRAVQVLQNIMENASKYGDGRQVVITFSQEEECSLVTIVNSGCSLQKSELPYIFDQFWRGSNVKNQSGNGLGLSICRQLMKKMDGDIFAECDENEMRVTIVLRML